MSNCEEDGCENGHDRERVGLSDDLFRTLENRDRRYALYFLLEHETVSLTELADVVTGWTHARTQGAVCKRVYDQVLLELRIRHLPVMVDAELVEFDREDERVSLASVPDSIQWFLLRTCKVETGPKST